MMGGRNENQAVRRRNLDLGWCACGMEIEQDCECDGLYRLGLYQGLYAPDVERASLHPDLVPPLSTPFDADGHTPG